jgi:hypothetical protein
VIDGGDIASVNFTAQALSCVIKDKTCICHQLNNIIKRMLSDYFEEEYLIHWRTFISRIRKSKPFEELWTECCTIILGEEIILQPDTPTRWSSTVLMLQKACKVKQAVERMVNITKNTEHFVCN